MAFKLPAAITVVDFEFISNPGERPVPVCMVARELRTRTTWRLWADQLGPRPPFPIGPDALVVAYYASAELGCFKALNWPMPPCTLDLFVEFKNLMNGLETPAGHGLLGALTYFNI